MATDEKVMMMEIEEVQDKKQADNREQKHASDASDATMEIDKSSTAATAYNGIIHEYAVQQTLPHEVNIGEVFDQVGFCEAKDACFGRLKQKRHRDYAAYSMPQHYQKPKQRRMHIQHAYFSKVLF